MAALPGFTVPNDSSSYADQQSEVHEADFQIMAQGHAATGVLSGCAVTAQGSPDQTVAVAAGQALVNGIPVSVTAGNVSMAAADGSNPRYDLVTIDSAGTKGKVDGTAAANPDKPDVPANKTVIAEVWRPTSDNTIETDKIVDKRLFVNAPAKKNALAPTGALIESFSRVDGVAMGNQNALSTGVMLAVAFDLPYNLLITSITFMSAGTALGTGTHQIFGIFDDSAGTSSGTARALLRGTSDDTSTAWGTFTAKTLTLSSTYTTVRAGLHYVGILVAATTPPTLAGALGFSNVAMSAVAPIVVGTTGSGLTALPNPAAALTSSTIVPWCWLK